MSPRSRSCGAAALVLLCCAIVLPSTVASGLPCWQPPTSAQVVDPFRPPACTWCAGNRGLEYATGPGRTIRAVATGRVSFAGNVAGTVYVVVRHGDGRRVTYGNLVDESYDRGDLIVRGAVVGRAAGAFHLGVRERERFVDPAAFIGRWVRNARLVPVDGTRGVAAPPARLRCGRR